MYDEGTHIVHQRHGAGTVLPTRIVTQDGEPREYFCIELSNNRGMVMIPHENLNADEIRPALTDMTVIREVLHQPPEDLGGDHRARQNTVRALLKHREPKQLAQALRDLAWRERSTKLTFTDSQLKEEAQRLLTQELALAPTMDTDSVRSALNRMVQEAMTAHRAEIADAADDTDV